MNNLLIFNTGRTYTHAGQRIAAELRDDGSIVFVDIDRDIYGTIIPPEGFSRDDVVDHGLFTPLEILKDYDSGWRLTGIIRVPGTQWEMDYETIERLKAACREKDPPRPLRPLVYNY